MRVQALLRDVPPPPEWPVPPGFSGWLETVSRRHQWLRPPLKLASYLLGTAVVSIAGMLVLYALDLADWVELSVETFALIYAGVHWSVFLLRRLERLALDHPRAAGMATTMGVAIPGNLVLGMLGHSDLSSEKTWVLVLALAVFGGWLIGTSEDEEESEVIDPPPAPETLAAADDRVIHIPQRDAVFRE